MRCHLAITHAYGMSQPGDSILYIYCYTMSLNEKRAHMMSQPGDSVSCICCYTKARNNKICIYDVTTRWIRIVYILLYDATREVTTFTLNTHTSSPRGYRWPQLHWIPLHCLGGTDYNSYTEYRYHAVLGATGYNRYTEYTYSVLGATGYNSYTEPDALPVAQPTVSKHCTMK